MSEIVGITLSCLVILGFFILVERQESRIQRQKKKESKRVYVPKDFSWYYKKKKLREFK